MRFFHLREYTMNYGLTLEHWPDNNDHHAPCLSTWSGVSSEVADSEYAIILEQVENGVAAWRCLFACAGQGETAARPTI